MNLVLQLIVAFIGGAGTTYLNDRYSDPTKMLRPRQVGPVVLTPGAQVSAGVLLLLGLTPKTVLPAGTFRSLLGTAAVGGAVVEGSKVAGDQILPVLKGQKAPAPQLPAGAAPAVAGWGYPAFGHVGFAPPSALDASQLLTQSLAAMRN